MFYSLYLKLMLLLGEVGHRQSFGGLLLLSGQHAMADGAVAWEVRHLELTYNVVTK